MQLPAHHLVTHAVVVGMTGSGKSGLVTVLVEEALSAGIPALVIDVKGDLPNLLLSFPDCAPENFLHWSTRRARGNKPTRWGGNGNKRSPSGRSPLSACAPSATKRALE